MLTRRERTPLRKLMLLGAMAGAGALVEDTATGNPLTFITDIAKPLKSLLIPFTPVQSGSGDPSPQNVRPIVPWDGLKVWNGGVNVWDEQWEVGSIDETNGRDEPGNDRIRSKGYISVTPSTRYYRTAPNNIRVIYYDANKQYISYTGYGVNNSFLTPDNCRFIRFNTAGAYGNVYKNDIAINYPSTETDYEAPHITETAISFPSPVYGGYVDMVTGEVWATWEAIEKTWGELKIYMDAGGYREGRANFVNPIPVSGESGASATYQKCNIAKYSWQDFDGTAHFYTAKVGNNYRVSVYLPIDTDDSTEIVVVCKLKSPVLITTLTPTQITALKGDNTIWSDADGSMTAVYLKKG